MAQPSFNINEDLLDELDSTLTYGDSRSQWVRDAIRLKLDVLDEVDEDMTDKERREFVIEAVRSAVEEK